MITRILPSLAVLTGLVLGLPAWAAFQADATQGTVTDDVTGLVWDQGTFAGNACVDGEIQHLSITTYAWQAALQAVVMANTCSYKNHSDWRLPNIQELSSLARRDRSNPAMDVTAFPGAPVGRFWSSTSLASNPTRAWTVGFFDGTVDWSATSDVPAYRYPIRLVRAGQPFSSMDVLDTTAPVVTGPTATPGAGGTTASAIVSANESATGYWLVQPADAAAPGPADVRASINPPVALAPDAPADFSITGLRPGTAYVLYFLAEDSRANQSGVQQAAFTTPGSQLVPTPVPTQSPWILVLMGWLAAMLARRRIEGR